MNKLMEPLDAIMLVMAEGFDPAFGEAWTRRQVADSLIVPTTYYSIDWKGDEARGFTLSRHVSGEEELLLISVRPQFRDIGVGKRLMGQFLTDARSRGAERVFLEMRSGNAAEHLYRKFGFSEIGRRKGYYRGAIGGPLDAVTFATTLD